MEIFLRLTEHPHSSWPFLRELPGRTNGLHFITVAFLSSHLSPVEESVGRALSGWPAPPRGRGHRARVSFALPGPLTIPLLMV